MLAGQRVLDPGEDVGGVPGLSQAAPVRAAVPPAAAVAMITAAAVAVTVPPASRARRAVRRRRSRAAALASPSGARTPSVKRSMPSRRSSSTSVFIGLIPLSPFR